MTVPSMGGTGELFYPAQFAFNAPQDSGGDSSSSETSRIRGVEMLRANALAQAGYQPGVGGSGFSANPNAYYGLQQQQQQQNQAVGPNDAWQFSTDFRMPMQRKMDDGFAQYLPAGASSQLGGPSAMMNPTNLDFNNANTNGSGGPYGLHGRRGSIDAYSDGSGLSAPNSAASSSVHLPLDFNSTDLPPGGQQIQPLSTLYQFDENQHPPPSREGRVASSFGLMTLADGDQPFIGDFNNANNNINADGTAPFFSQHAMKLPPQDSTPRPFRNDDNRAGQSLNSPRDREAEMRELRDFWKQYLRTPLTGPSLGQTPKAELLNNQFGSFGDAARPTPKRGLSRVASLPSVRTPPEEKGSVLPSRVTNSHSQSHAQLPAVQTADDLKSYEQAVLARKPLNLTFVPRKGRHSISSSASPQPIPEQQQQLMQAQMAAAGQNATSNMFARPGPLAAFNSTDGGNSSDDNPISDNASVQRPNFKRLASQTLENATQKRTMFRWGESEDALDDSESDMDVPSDIGSPPNRFDTVNSEMRTSSMSPTSYHRGMQLAHAGVTGSGADALLDRFRRQSAPTGMRPLMNGMDTGNGNVHENSPSPLQASHTQSTVNMSMNAPQPGLPGIDSSALVPS